MRSTWKNGLVVLVGLLLVSPVVASLGVDTIGVVATIIVVVLLVAFTTRVRTAEGGDDQPDHSVWDVIPSWQYTGRHVESGGLSREEQERALREVQDEADEISRRDRE